MVDCLDGAQNVTVTAKIESCVDGGCNGHGDCREYIKSSDFIVLSTCVCAAGNTETFAQWRLLSFSFVTSNEACLIHIYERTLPVPGALYCHSARCSVLPQRQVFAVCAVVMHLLSLRARNFKSTEPILLLFFFLLEH